MKTRIALILCAAVIATGCADSDGDGLSNGKESRLGTDADDRDSDNDGLDDALELEEGTDPLEWDSDGDTYADGDELEERTDPLDDDDRIYEGYWPYNRDKDDLDDLDIEGRIRVGDQLAHLIGVDQFGEEVDVFDYAGHGKPVLVDISTVWCPPCNEMAGWLDGGSMQGMGAFEPLREAVDNGDIYWITVLTEDAQGRPPDEDNTADWYDLYSNPNVPIIASDSSFTAYMGLEFYPSVYLFDEDLELVSKPGNDWAPPLYDAMDLVE